jgi:putative cell wall-binding protein
MKEEVLAIGSPMSTLEKYIETVKSYGISLKQFSGSVASVTNAPMPELASINVKIDDVVELSSKL